MQRPCTFCRPASTISNFDESIIKGTLHTSGSVAAMRRNFVMAVTPSSMPSSTLTSTTMAPSSICLRATAMASM